ncbi:polysaccharide deacetylase family protein [Brevibacillus fluminis]|uniref:polysaccharide deacetylase family protein n=1 Tax=Brevibacillus fluminis TaxID=511487 RepID=UPI003F8AFD18
MFKRISFLITFLIVLVTVVAGGFWSGGATDSVQPAVAPGAVEAQTANEPAEAAVSKEADWQKQPEQQSQPVKKQKWYDNQVVVLTYHHVSDKTDRQYEISPSELKAHLDFLRENDFHPISLTEFLRFVDTGVLATENAVLLTFDDGYESYYTEAFPLLQQYGYPSVNFLIAGRLRDSVDRKRPNMTTPLSEQEVNELLASGLSDIGSHTYSLHEQAEKNEWGDLTPQTAPVYLEDLSRLENEQEYKNRLYVDFMMSRVALSQIAKKEIRVISYPFGFSNETVTETAKQAGYQYAFNSRPDVVKAGTNRFELPRYDVGMHTFDTQKLLELFTKVKTGF